MSSAAGVLGTAVYHANDVYDPRDGTGGHQPLTFDQYMTFYDHFVVVGSKLTVKVTHGEDTPIIVGCYVKDNNTVQSDANIVWEQPRVKWFTMPQQLAGGAAPAFTYKFSTRKFLGRSKVLSDPQLKGDASSTPQELAHYHIFVYKPDGTPIDSCTVFIQIDYAVVLIEPKVIGLS